MTKTRSIFYAIIFSVVIVISNYAVNFPINDWLTYGALTYPFSFLLTDIISEKYSKKDAFNTVRWGVLIAIIPTILLVDLRLALASIFTFFFVQQLDIIIFHYLKTKHKKLWWLRNNASTIISQFIDTFLFFILAFAFTMPFGNVLQLAMGDYWIKIIFALIDTPLFYWFACRIKT